MTEAQLHRQVAGFLNAALLAPAVCKICGVQLVRCKNEYPKRFAKRQICGSSACRSRLMVLSAPTRTPKQRKDQASKPCMFCGTIITKRDRDTFKKWAKRRACRALNCRRLSQGAAQNQPVMPRIMEDVYPDPMSGCWLWAGKINNQKYGLISYNGKYRLIHRIVFEHYNGLIPDGLIVRHRCDNTYCVSPEHLLVGTPKDNTQDAISRGRAPHLVKGGRRK